MKVFELSSQTVLTVNDSYGARMIEQGKAVIPPKDKPKEEPPQDMPAEEGAPAKKAEGAKKR